MDIKLLASKLKINLTKKEEKYFEAQFDKTIKIIDEFNTLDIKKTLPTYSVTGTKNILREDIVDVTRILSQDDALLNAKKTHNGYFVVDQILNDD